MKPSHVTFAVLVGLFVLRPCFSEELQPIANVSFGSQIVAAEDVSAIAAINDFLLIASDEAVGEKENENYVQVLRRTGANQYRVDQNILVLQGDQEDGREMDIEGITVSGHDIYVIGSHSRRRKNVKSDEKLKANVKTFSDDEIRDEKSRYSLFRLTVDANVQVTNREKTSLRDIIENDPVLKTFDKIPSKENGVDIEGLAVKDDWLYVGFRGPVFRANYVPVMKLKFDDPEASHELLFVDLGGRGIRDITSVSGGFLILAGPVGDGPGSYQLCFWDGNDMIPGSNRHAEDVGHVSLLGEITPPENGKAEGTVVLSPPQDTTYDLVIVYDGAQDGGAQRFRVLRQ